MLTRISRVLTVFVTAASLAFLGLALAVNFSGPNWIQETQNLPDYAFTLAPGEIPTWSAKHRTSDQQLSSSPTLPNVIGKAYDDARQRNQEVIERVEPQIQPLESRIATVSNYVTADSAGIDVREAQLTDTLKAVEKQIIDISVEGERKSAQAVEVRAEAERTREFVFRLKRELQQIETDDFQLVEQKRLLLDLLYQMKGLERRLKEREQHLIEQRARITDGDGNAIPYDADAKPVDKSA